MDDVVTPLYGHTSEDTAYLVSDYPYGRNVRCRIRYWIEYNPHHGFRFVSQTEDPRSLRWNKPKKSTYAPVAAAMYLDHQGHVQWRCLSYHSSASQCREFMKTFPQIDHAEILKVFILAQIQHLKIILGGRLRISIANQLVEMNESKLQNEKDLQEWSSLLLAS